MRAFIVSIVALLVIGIATWGVLNSVQQSSGERYSTDSVRL